MQILKIGVPESQLSAFICLLLVYQYVNFKELCDCRILFILDIVSFPKKFLLCS